MNYWLIAAGAVLILELLSGTFYLLIVSLALFGAGLSAWIFQDPVLIPIWVSSVLSLIGIFFIYQHHQKKSTATNTDQNDLDIGQIVILHNIQNNGLWHVHYRGAQWQAQCINIPTVADHLGKRAIIRGKNSNILQIEILPNELPSSS